MKHVKLCQARSFVGPVSSVIANSANEDIRKSGQYSTEKHCSSCAQAQAAAAVEAATAVGEERVWRDWRGLALTRVGPTGSGCMLLEF